MVSARAEGRLESSVEAPGIALIGRERELRHLRALLTAHRLVTVTGPSGAGKTRLAGAVARGAARPVWIDLSGVNDPAFVAQAAAQQAGADPSADAPPDVALACAIGEGDSLVILDNCEHVVAAAASLTQSLLRRCPRALVLATSLQPLGVPGERILALPPLATKADWPQTADPPRALSDAASLFVLRAAEVDPGFVPSPHDAACIEAICTRLDGLPLAIELAAARMRVLTAEQIAARLDDALDLLGRGTPAQARKHQALRAVLDWTYGLLTPNQRAMFRRLGAFPGSFTIEQLEAVADMPDSLDALTDLVDRSLVQIESRSSGKRFRLLLVIAQYARERLESEGDAAEAKTRLLDWLTRWAESAEPRLTGPDQNEWYGRIAVEEDACRSMLRWACTSRQPELGLRLANALWRFWLWRDQLVEGRAWLNELLAIDADEVVAPIVRAQALFGAGRIACRQGDDDTADRQGQHSLAIFRAVGHEAGQVRALSLLALVAQDRGEIALAAERYAEALALSRRIADVYYTGVLLVNLGLLHHGLAELDRAEACFREAAALAHADSQAGRAALGNVADVLLRRGDPAGAASVLDDVIARDTALGNRAAAASALATLAEAAMQMGDTVRAEALAREALQLHERSGAVTSQCDDHVVLGLLAAAAGDAPRARVHFTYALTAAERSAYPLGWCRATIGLARLDLDRGAAGKLACAALERARSASARLVDVEAAEAWAEALEPTEPARAATLLESARAERERRGLAIAATDRARLNSLSRKLADRLGAQHAQLTTAALDAGFDTVIARMLRPTPPIGAGASPSGPTPRVRIELLGPVVVRVDGTPIPASAWTYAKSRELVLYLAARGPSGKDRIGLDLWPDATAAQVRNNFHRALYHARRALGGEGWIVYSDGCYSLQPGDDVWCDLREFDRVAAAIRPADVVRLVDRSTAIEQLEQAAALWRGEPMQDVDAGEWCIYLREAERLQVTRLLSHLGALHFADARYQAATGVYRRLLELDQYYEFAHRELMRCMARQGETGHAVQHYAALAEALERELGVEPSLETTLLCERIRRGEAV